MVREYYVSTDFAKEFLGLENLDEFFKIEINVEDGYITSVWGIKGTNATDFGIECQLGNGALDELEEAAKDFVERI